MYKITRLKLYLFLFVSFILEITVFEGLKIFGTKPDVLLIVVIFTGLFGGPRIGLEAGAFAGIMVDIFGISSFGAGIFAYGVTGILSGVLNKGLYKESFLTQSILVSFFTLIVHLVNYILKFNFPRVEIYSYHRAFFNPAIFKAVLCNSIWCPVRFIVAYKIFGLKRSV